MGILFSKQHEYLLNDQQQEEKQYVPPTQLNDRPWLLSNGEFYHLGLEHILQNRDMNLIQKLLDEQNSLHSQSLLCAALHKEDIVIAELALKHPSTNSMMNTLPYVLAKSSKNLEIRSLQYWIRNKMDSQIWEYNRGLL